jgi:shikimate dehydrogenase
VPLSARRLGVIGWPVFHSRSPAMQRAALRAAGLDAWTYQHVPAPPQLAGEIIAALAGAGFAGVNVTVPHKHLALAMADSASPAARAIGAANHLAFSREGAIAAENTDAPGMIAAIGRDLAGESAMVLGSGGTARAACWALREAGATVAVWNRTPERARTLAKEFGIEAVQRPRAARVLVNTTTVGMDGRLSEAATLEDLALGTDELGSYEQVVDFVYSSTPTRLVTIARRMGIATVDGLEILVGQGALSFEHWTGAVASLEVMRAAAEGVLDG